jgi:quercetin 2,3-dioxygenase
VNANFSICCYPERMSVFLSIHPLDFVWHTFDPFLFCVHHHDLYPAGNSQLGPAVSLSGRQLGNDFEGRDGWRMYHGETVPGFPQHPHRGFETVTIARQGFIDHSDSLGAKARFGQGDAQWLTAGRGIVHSEMFPLLKAHEDNPVELFQIWVNLPKVNKMADPYFSMLWNSEIPELRKSGALLRAYAGSFPQLQEPPKTPPNSWAAQPGSDVAIWTISLEANGELTLPPAKPNTTRALYVFEGATLTVNQESTSLNHGYRVDSTQALRLETQSKAQVLVLQGRPIGEPVVSYGPFVMNSREEIQRAFMDYQATQFGGWPFPQNDPNHGKDSKRFVIRANGIREDAP